MPGSVWWRFQTGHKGPQPKTTNGCVQSCELDAASSSLELFQSGSRCCVPAGVEPLPTQQGWAGRALLGWFLCAAEQQCSSWLISLLLYALALCCCSCLTDDAEQQSATRVVCELSTPCDYAVSTHLRQRVSGSCFRPLSAALPCPFFPSLCTILSFWCRTRFCRWAFCWYMWPPYQLPGAPYLVGAFEHLQLGDLCGQCVWTCVSTSPELVPCWE